MRRHTRAGKDRTRSSAPSPTSSAEARRSYGKGKGMHRNMRVDDLAAEVLARQARTPRAKSTGEPFEAALEVVLETEAGRQLEELRDGPHRDESARGWQNGLPRERAEERALARRGGRRRATERTLSATSR
jgi:hypothetical protein